MTSLIAAARGYRRLFALPGARAFTTGNLLARLPVGMFSVSAVVMIAGSRGSYALAGAVSATGLAATAVAGPWLARLVDRHGQARIALPATVVAVLSSLALLLCVRYDAPDWTLFAAYTGIAATPNIGGLSRAPLGPSAARRARGAAHRERLRTGRGRAVLHAGAGAGVLPDRHVLPGGGHTRGGGAAARRHAAVHGPAGHRAPPRARSTAPSPLRSRALLPLLACCTATGVVFGAMEVATIAFADARGQRAAAGAVLALQAAGSCAAGLATGR